jgi:hypothetical protein
MPPPNAREMTCSVPAFSHTNQQVIESLVGELLQSSLLSPPLGAHCNFISRSHVAKASVNDTGHKVHMGSSLPCLNVKAFLVWGQSCSVCTDAGAVCSINILYCVTPCTSH